MRFAKRKYTFILILSFFISFSLYYQSSSYGDFDSFQSEKIGNDVNLNFIAKIERGRKLKIDCFTFFMSYKYSVTTDDCAHESLTTVKKLADPLEGNDYYKSGSNGLLLNSVIKPATSANEFSLIFTEKFINHFVNVNFNYNIMKSGIYYIPVVINKDYIYLYTAMLDQNKGIINFKELPDNCEILAGSPIFTQNLETGIGISAMVSQHHPCSKNNRVTLVRSTDIGYEINKISNCVSFYLNLPGYIDNIGKCNFTHYP